MVYEGRHQPVPIMKMLKRTVEDYAERFYWAELEELKQPIDEAGREDIRAGIIIRTVCITDLASFSTMSDLIKKNKEYHILLWPSSVVTDRKVRVTLWMSLIFSAQ